MGGWLSRSDGPPSALSTKRKIDDDFEKEKPLKKRLRSTYDYVYRELFCKGEGSDLTVKCLNKTWTLHRLYVKQSPFFSAMLEGGWKESGCSVIELELSDPNITTEALQTVFGSFYRDSVFISESSVLGVLAASTWFHMDDIRSLCSEFMMQRICLRNVVDFYQISMQYNLPDLSKGTVNWLAENLLLLDDSTVTYEFLRQIPIDLMRETIERPDLAVVQVEQDVFLLLLKWVFVLTHPQYEYKPGTLPIEDAYRFFVSKGHSYLDTPEGAAFAPVFKAIRWEHVVNVYRATERLMRDRLIPEAWLSRVFCRQWLRILRSHEMHTSAPRSSPPGNGLSTSGSPNESPSRSRVTLSSHLLTYPSSLLDLNLGEPGPPADLPEEVFWATSERCGRRMQSGDVTCSWRWTGYHFGFDVVVKYKRRTFSVIRFSEPHAAEGSVSHARRLRLLISLRIRSVPHDLSASLEHVVPVQTTEIDMANSPIPEATANENSSCRISTGVLSLSLEENVLHELIRLPDDFCFPVVLSANILRYDPLDWNPAPPVPVDTMLV